jgi:hypothetical protein
MRERVESSNGRLTIDNDDRQFRIQADFSVRGDVQGDVQGDDRGDARADAGVDAGGGGVG